MFKFQTLAQKSKLEGIDYKKDAEAARFWFRNLAYNTNYANPKEFQANAGPFQNLNQLTTNSIGKLYFFAYDPKHALTLNYYDVFPIIFPIELPYNKGSSPGMLGINLHYLPPYLRARLMNALYQTMNNENYNKTTKLIINYKILKSASQFKYFKPCIHHYLFNHVKSPFQYIDPKFWDYVALLPLERFKKASRERVWMESILKVD